MSAIPGPWEVDLETGEIVSHGAVLGTIYGADDFPCCEEDIDEECKANARLIASAPDLLEACKAARNWLDNPLFERASIIDEKLRKAIAKAEGKDAP